MALIFFLLPLIAYLGSYRIGQFHKQLVPIVGAISISLVASFSFLGILFYTNPLTESKRVVLSGLRSRDAEITIGGPRQEAGFGWINGLFAPVVSAKINNDKIDLTISGGEGFVRETLSGAYLNGRILGEGESSTHGGFEFQRKIGLFRSSDQIEISRNGELAVVLNLPAPKGERVSSLEKLIEKATADLTPTGNLRPNLWLRIQTWLGNVDAGNPAERFQTIADLKSWARGVRILQSSSSGEVFILVPEEEFAATCNSPCRFTMHWINSKVDGELVPDNGKLVLEYLPPIRNSSPLPPDEAGGKLVVTDDPLPGDYAFTVPVGYAETIGAAQERGRSILDLNALGRPRAEDLPIVVEPANDRKCEFLPRRIASEINCSLITGPRTELVFSLVEDLPRVWIIVAIVFVALIVFLSGLAIANPNLTFENRWAIFGLCATLWTFLLVRLLFAIRYASDPTYLDAYAIGDVILASIGLITFPGFLLLLTRLRSDFLRDMGMAALSRHRAICIGYAILLGLMFVFGFFASRDLIWNDLPVSLVPSYGIAWWILFILAQGYLLLHINYLYRIKVNSLSSSPMKENRFVRFFLLGIWDSPRRLCRAAAEGWRDLFLKESLRSNVGLWRVLRIEIVALVLVMVLLILSSIFNWHRDLLFTQVLLPVLFCGLPIILWLESRPPSETTSHKRSSFIKAILLAVLVLVPFFFALGLDPGSIYGYLAIFVPTVLIVSFRRERWWANQLPTVIIGILILFLFVLIGTRTFDRFLGLSNSAAPRILAYREGSEFENHLLSADAGTGQNDIGLDISDLTSTYQHLWENKAIAHESGPLGFGFAKSPVRQSQVRQDTIQFDSFFSFYILGDFGFVGGAMLLLMYFVPLTLVYVAGRHYPDAGYCLAMIICSAFLLEALTHAGMNLWVLPLTGRSMPMLAVHSFRGDLLRWLIFFGFAINSMFWRSSPDGGGADGVEPVLTPSGESREVPDLASIPSSWSWQHFRPQFILRGLVVALPVYVIPVSFFLVVNAVGISVLLDNSVKVFSWDSVRKNVNDVIQLGMVTVVQDDATRDECPKLVLDESKYRLKWARSNPETSFLRQQVNQLNSLPCAERFDQGSFQTFEDDIRNLSDLNAYQTFLRQMGRTVDPGKESRRPLLLAVERNEEDSGNEETSPFVVTFNPAFNIHRTFSVANSAEDIPRVSFKNSETRLVGPAWNKGRWVSAVDRDPALLSWTGWMGSAIFARSRSTVADSSKLAFESLSLDLRLQKATMAFVDQRGLELHGQTIKGTNKLPPRIGLVVLRISGTETNGETVALGTFPRTTSGRKWQNVCYQPNPSLPRSPSSNCMWLPPADFVDRKFPHVMRRLYEGDKNFESSIVMGSSTKPIFASAVLAVHPTLDLNKNFRVSGSPVLDRNIFGIDIGPKPWSGHGSRAQWVDFDRFLTESNNRYQVLFGFLGLARSNGSEILTETRLPARYDTVSFKERLWNQTPVFQENIGFGFSSPNLIRRLEDTELARKLQSMYGMNVVRFGDERPSAFGDYMNSFWTRDENDDLPNDKNIFPPVILPARVNLRLNQLCETADPTGRAGTQDCRPRDFVTLLLGGGENRWSNVQIAAAFGTAVTGKPILPTIVSSSQSPKMLNRTEFVPISKMLRRGLRGVVFETNGTANATLPRRAIEILAALDRAGYKVFAKTGTLATSGIPGNTTRLLLAIVRFEDGGETKVRSGLVMSIFAQRTATGTAARWLGQFIVENEGELRRLLQ